LVVRFCQGARGKIESVNSPVDHHSPAAPRPTLWQDCGLVRPRPAPDGRSPDPHLLLAIAIALPVWAVLGLVFGGQMRVPAGWFAWVSFVLLQPVLEELVFRGILQGLLLRLTTTGGQTRRLGPVSLANLGVTLGFVALHLPAQPLAWALAVAVPSLVLGHLRDRTASVWPCILVHVTYNAGFALTAWLASG